jgi:hypothetical protein
MEYNLEQARRFPTSTRRLRDIKAMVLLATVDKEGCVTHSVTLHFFEDCWLGYHEKSNNGKWPLITHKVYSKDYGLTWLEYKDQFEPKEGKHVGVEYNPTDASFPSRQW